MGPIDHVGKIDERPVNQDVQKLDVFNRADLYGRTAQPESFDFDPRHFFCAGSGRAGAKGAPHRCKHPEGKTAQRQIHLCANPGTDTGTGHGHLAAGQSQHLPCFFVEQVVLENRAGGKRIGKDIVPEPLFNPLMGLFFKFRDLGLVGFQKGFTHLFDLRVICGRFFNCMLGYGFYKLPDDGRGFLHALAPVGFESRYGALQRRLPLRVDMFQAFQQVDALGKAGLVGIEKPDDIEILPGFGFPRFDVFRSAFFLGVDHNHPGKPCFPQDLHFNGIDLPHRP